MSNNSRFSRILLRGGTRDELKTINPMLKEREPIVEYDTGKMKIGDGVNRYNKLRYVGQSSIPEINSFSIIKCITDINGKSKTFTNGNVSDNSIVKEIVFKYKISSSPDRILLYYTNNDNVFFSENYPETLEREISLKDINISSTSKDNVFGLKLEAIDGSPTTTTQINFYPYMYYGHGSIDKIKNLITEFNDVECSEKLISSASNEIKSIQCNEDYIFFFLPKSIYGTSGAKFQDIDVPIGWGGFAQLDKNGEIVTSFTPNDNRFIKINNKDYYIYRSENIITSTPKNIRINKN